MFAADPLLLTILDRPDDDAPRLVFADWLEEQGEPQAELIRVQCEWAHLDKGDPRRGALERREGELRQIYDPVWFGPLRENNISGKFRRGFLQVKVKGIRRFLELAERLLSRPWVLHVELEDKRAGREALVALVNSPYFVRLRGLDLSGSRLGNEGVNLLTRARTPCRLTHLDLSNNQISTNAVRALTESLDLSHLLELRLSGNGIGAQGARALATCSRLARLRVLDLTYNLLGNEGGQHLSEAKSLNQLQRLLVRGNSIGPRGSKALRRRFGPRVYLGNRSL
jgi:uncharacterized protein (TIGR02996 family)